MDKSAAVLTLRRSVTEWNLYRAAHPDWTPDLRGADLHGTNLHRANLANADLCDTLLEGVTLSGANCIAADFSRAKLRDAKFEINPTDREAGPARCSRANFEGADLSQACFRNVDLRDTSFRNAECYATKFANADLRNADFRGALFLENPFASSIATGNGLASAIVDGTLFDRDYAAEYRTNSQVIEAAGRERVVTALDDMLKQMKNPMLKKKDRKPWWRFW